MYAKFGAFTLTDWTISQNIASNSHCFGHTDSRAGPPWNFNKRAELPSAACKFFKISCC